LDSKWEHTLWVLNKGDTPKTVAAFEEIGIEVKELKGVPAVKAS